MLKICAYIKSSPEIYIREYSVELKIKCKYYIYIPNFSEQKEQPGLNLKPKQTKILIVNKNVLFSQRIQFPQQ